jgi:hypothetical protein
VGEGSQEIRRSGVVFLLKSRPPDLLLSCDPGAGG